MRPLDGIDGVRTSGNGGEVGQTHAAALPVTFCGTVGLYQSAVGNTSATGVIFASPWGLEELCTTHKFWRVIAEKLSAQGIASLRFDWPGTGDSLDDIDFSSGIAVWRDALIEATAQLKALSGCTRIIVISQSLGGAIVADTATAIEGLDAIIFSVPVLSGRHYLRELSVWSRMVDADLGLGEVSYDKDTVSIASLTMPQPIADWVRRVNLLQLDAAPATHCLVLGREGRPSDAAFADHLRGLGADVELDVFQDFDKLISNPAISRLPVEMADKIVSWVKGRASDETVKGAVLPIDRLPSAKPLAGDGFQETPVRFGAENRLSGVLCEPSGEARGATVVFLSSSYDRHAGWGRSTLAMARQLAERGIASLRFDTANVGDSPPVFGAPDQVLYHDIQKADVAEAVDFLQARGRTRPVLVGRCSGAFLAFQSAVSDERVGGVVATNIITFYWQPGRSVDEAIREGNRTLEEYGSRMLRASTFKRLFRGQLDLVSITRNLSRSLGRRIKGVLRRLLRSRTAEGKSVYGNFNKLRSRHVPVTLVYSERDPGLEHFSFYFDSNGADVSGFANVKTVMVRDADHNLTPEHARMAYLEAIEQMALRVG